MHAGKTRYETKSVKTLKATQNSTIKKWEDQGWELVHQEDGRLQSILTFRKPKKPLSPLLIFGVIALVLILVGAIVVGSMTEDKSSEKPVAEISSPTQENSTTSSPTARESSAGNNEVVTIENNAEFAALVQGTDCGENVSSFASKYEGKTIEFDGYISNIQPYKDYKTRDDILLSPGDYKPDTAQGPNFKFENVSASNLYFPDNEPVGTLKAGDNLRIKATVEKYENGSCVIYLKPVETRTR